MPLASNPSRYVDCPRAREDIMTSFSACQSPPIASGIRRRPHSFPKSRLDERGARLFSEFHAANLYLLMSVRGEVFPGSPSPIGRDGSYGVRAEVRESGFRKKYGSTIRQVLLGYLLHQKRPSLLCSNCEVKVYIPAEIGGCR